MSVRRRAIRERLERETLRRDGFDRMKASLEAVRSMCDRMVSEGETHITMEELKACFLEVASLESNQ